MEFNADKNELLTALARVIGAVDKRTLLPILNHVLVTVFLRNTISITATDLDIFASADAAAGVPRDGGEFCVPAEKLKGALEAAPGDRISFDFDGEKELTITSEECRFVLATLPADQFPLLPNPNGGDIGTFPQGIFGRIVKAIGHAVSRDSLKGNLGTICLCDHNGGRITAVATDGHRLSLASFDGNDPEICNPDLMLPIKTVRLLACINDSLTITRFDAQNIVHFDGRSSRVSSRLIEGDYPDYRRVIPTDYTKSVHVDSDCLIAALEACGVVSDGKARSASLTSAGENLLVTALGSQGELSYSIPCGGDSDLIVSVNATYLLQALKALGGEVFIKYDTGSKPLLIIPVDHGYWTERLEVVMPVRK